MFERSNDYQDFIEVEGIEFRPLEKVKHRDEKQLMSDSDSDSNWEENLPTDYEDIMKWSTNSVQWTTKKEAYTIISKGFLIDDGKKWFSIDKNGKKWHMISADRIWSELKDDMMPLPESRFGKAILLEFATFAIDCHIQSHLVSSGTAYATYLVYKLLENQSGFEAPLKIQEDNGESEKFRGYCYLVSPQTPVIRTKADQRTCSPISWLNRNNIMPPIIPQQRNDGWMEVQIWKFQTRITSGMISLRLHLSPCDGMTYKGLVIQGVEFRPNNNSM